MLRNSGDNAEEGETDGGRREGEAYLTVALVVLLVVVAKANDGGQAVCSQCMAIPDSVSALSLFCDFFHVSSSPRFYLLLLCLFFLSFFFFYSGSRWSGCGGNGEE
jgi:hypothetical protein